MQKTWCTTTGTVYPQRHFYLDPSPFNAEVLVPALKDKQWVTLIGPSQSGKTTRTLVLRDQLCAQGFCAIYINVRELVDEALLQHGFFRSFTAHILRHTDPELPPEKSLWSLFHITNAAFFRGKKVILLFDHIDALSALADDERQHFLAVLNSLKRAQEPRSNVIVLWSALAVSNHVGNYLLDTLKNFPFFNPSVAAPFLTREEHLALYEQYERQEQAMDPRVKQQIFEETGGMQGLEQLVGQFYHEKYLLAKAPLSITEWLHCVYSGELLDYLEGSYPNFWKMTQFLLSREPLAMKCRSLLASLDLRSYFPESIELLRMNILRRTPIYAISHRLEFACPLVRHFVLKQLVRLPRPLCKLPPLGDAPDCAFPKLVLEVLKAMNPLEITYAQRKTRNMASISRRTLLYPPGPKKGAYVRQFTSALLRITSNFAKLSNVESKVAVDLPQDLQECPWPAAFPERSCDTLFSCGIARIVIEHAANASIDPQSRNKDSVIYHTEVKARQYKHALKANQAWVIDWTTVPPPDGGYPFTGADNAVRVIYVHHDESFRHIEVFWDGGKEIVEIALPAFTSVPKRKRDHDMDAKQPISVGLVDVETEYIVKSLFLDSYDIEELKHLAQARFKDPREVESITVKIGKHTVPLQDDEDVKKLRAGDTLYVTFVPK